MAPKASVLTEFKIHGREGGDWEGMCAESRGSTEDKGWINNTVSTQVKFRATFMGVKIR